VVVQATSNVTIHRRINASQDPCAEIRCVRFTKKCAVVCAGLSTAEYAVDPTMQAQPASIGTATQRTDSVAKAAAGEVVVSLGIAIQPLRPVLVTAHLSGVQTTPWLVRQPT